MRVARTNATSRTSNACCAKRCWRARGANRRADSTLDATRRVRRALDAGGGRCPVVGRVSLNITNVDVTDLPTPVRWGDEAVLVGRQGTQEITFEELADKFESVHTELNLSHGCMNQITYT